MSTNQPRPPATQTERQLGPTRYVRLSSLTRAPRRRAANRRRGFIVLVVMIVVVMVTLAGLSFVMTLTTENKAVHRQGDQLQLDEALASGVELVKAFCAQSPQRRQEAGGARDNEAVFGETPVSGHDDAETDLRMSVVLSAGHGPLGQTLQFGLQNESARLHLGVLLDWEQRQAGSAAAALMQLPNMTEAIAAAILDWIDGDGDPRPGGAEADYYAGQGLPYEPRNGVPALLEELLLIRDVSREMLLGPDAATAYAAAAEEFTVTSSAFAEISDQDLPWARLLTVHSGERNLTFDGEPRINLNDSDLKKLHTQLTEAFEQPLADFVVAYRQHGPSAEAPPKLPPSGRPRRSWRERDPTATPRARRQATEDLQLDLSAAARYEIESVLDLVGAAVVLPARPDALEDEPPPAVFSPLQDDPQSIQEQLPRLVDLTTTTEREVIYGRVNVNEAPRCVLLGIPGLEPAIVDRMLTLRDTISDGSDLGRRHGLWLLTEGLVDRPAMNALWPYVTGGGDVFRAQVVVRRSGSGRMARAEVVVDATGSPPRQVYWKNLGLLGGVHSNARDQHDARIEH